MLRGPGELGRMKWENVMKAEEINSKLCELDEILGAALAIEEELDYPSIGGANKKTVWCVFAHIQRARQKLAKKWPEISE